MLLASAILYFGIRCGLGVFSGFFALSGVSGGFFLGCGDGVAGGLVSLPLSLCVSPLRRAVGDGELPLIDIDATRSSDDFFV